MVAEELSCEQSWREIEGNFDDLHRKERDAVRALVGSDGFFQFLLGLTAESSLHSVTHRYDIHLDTIAAGTRPGRRSVGDVLSGRFRGTVQHFDALVTCRARVGYHVLVEAELDAWSNKELRPKLDWACETYGELGADVPGVVPLFVLASPGRPRHLNLSGLPSWLVPNGRMHWVALPSWTRALRVSRVPSGCRIVRRTD